MHPILSNTPETRNCTFFKLHCTFSNLTASLKTDIAIVHLYFYVPLFSIFCYCTAMIKRLPRLPLGISDFAKLREAGAHYLYVDKTQVLFDFEDKTVRCRREEARDKQ